MMSTVPLAPEQLKTKRWTQADFHRLPEGPPFYELENEELIEIARPQLRHQKLVGKLFAAISTHVEREKLGEVWPEVEVDITSEHTYVPDLSFLAVANLEQVEDDQRIVGAPDLVVEILSPSTATRDKSTKLRTCQRAGVPWYWIIEGDSLLVYEYKNTPDGYLLADIVAPPDVFSPKLFPGLALNLAELMGELNVEEAQNE